MTELALETIESILKILPHRYPFLMVDRVLEWGDQKSIRAVKNVSINEPYFPGHFPEMPIMPGVMILESLAQACGLLYFLSFNKEQRRQLPFFAGVDQLRFKHKVVPGDQLILEGVLLKSRTGMGKFSACAWVADQKVCEAELLMVCKDV